MMPALVGKALLLGLSTGLFCVGFCVPLVGPLLLSNEERGVRGSAGRVGLFLAGRLIAYILFGIVFGALGGGLARVWKAKPIFLPVLYAALGVMMILFGVVQSFPHIGLCRVLGPKVRSGWYLALAGFLAGINICPPFLLAVTTVMDIGGALRGALFFLVFFVATSVYLLPLFFAGFVSRLASVRFAARVAAIAAGGWYIFLAIRTFAV
jgi:sulfite exporter TauE/SafE